MADLFYLQNFWQGVSLEPFIKPYDVIPGVYFFCKDKQGKHVAVNKRTIQRCGKDHANEVLGKKDSDFYPAELCVKYARDDNSVIETGEPIINKSELALNLIGQVDWFITSKFPIHSEKGKAIGVVGITLEYNN